MLLAWQHAPTPVTAASRAARHLRPLGERWSALWLGASMLRTSWERRDAVTRTFAPPRDAELRESAAAADVARIVYRYDATSRTVED